MEKHIPPALSILYISRQNEQKLA